MKLRPRQSAKPASWRRKNGRRSLPLKESKKKRKPGC
jgi:hypothetical protein